MPINLIRPQCYIGNVIRPLSVIRPFIIPISIGRFSDRPDNPAKGSDRVVRGGGGAFFLLDLTVFLEACRNTLGARKRSNIS